MQTVLSTVYKNVSESSQTDLNIVKSVGDQVFQSLLNNFKKPPSLILKVRGLGYFYMRKNKLLETLEKMKVTEDRVEAGNLTSYETPEYLEERKKLKELLQKREQDYIRFLDKKKKIKELRKTKEDDNS